MNPGKVRIPKRGEAVEPRAGHIAFGTFGFASKHLAIESNQPFAVSCNEICVNVVGLDWHCFLPKFPKYQRFYLVYADECSGDRVEILLS
jgi:hypothetical protein